jgi:hypothetical protein
MASCRVMLFMNGLRRLTRIEGVRDDDKIRVIQPAPDSVKSDVPSTSLYAENLALPYRLRAVPVLSSAPR